MKSCRCMSCNHLGPMKIIFDEMLINFNMFGPIMLECIMDNAHG